MSIRKAFLSVVAVVLFAFSGIASARFIQADPIGLEGGINQYAYVTNNPLSWVDPEGLVNRNPNDAMGGAGGDGPGSRVMGGRGLPSGGTRGGASSPSSSAWQEIAGPYCSVPTIGTNPRAGAGRTNTTGTGDAWETFYRNTAPGPYRAEATRARDPRISGTGVDGGTTQIRVNADGSVRVDITPAYPQYPTTVHWPKP